MEFYTWRNRSNGISFTIVPLLYLIILDFCQWYLYYYPISTTHHVAHPKRTFSTPRFYHKANLPPAVTSHSYQKEIICSTKVFRISRKASSGLFSNSQSLKMCIILIVHLNFKVGSLGK